MKEVNYGVLGLGFTGRIHALNLLKTPGARIVAVADPDLSQYALLEEEVASQNEPKRMESLRAVQRFETPEALLRSAAIEALVVCLPTHLHEEWVCRALEKGLHVLCEKPIALDCIAADRMVDAAHKTGRCFMVAHCVRFWPEYIHLRHLVAEGRLGPLRSLNMWRLSGAPAWSSNQWILDTSLSGGPIVDLHIHDVDFALFLLGEPQGIQAAGRSSLGSKTPDIVHTIFEYERGPQVHLHAGWSRAPVPFRAGFEAWFENGFVRFSSGSDPSLEQYESGREGSLPVDIPALDAYQEELMYFTGSVLTHSEPMICTPQSSRESLAIVLKIMNKVRGK
ncbi:MAG: Gfo/Idh/MocA family oxidoreductase [Planctomycetota bacterium]